MARRVIAVLAMILTALAAGTAPSSAQPQVFRVHLGPSGDADGSGVAILRLDLAEERVCYTIVVRDIAAPVEPAAGVGSAHVHGPLPATGIALDLDTNFAATGTDTYIARDCVSATSAAIAALLADPESFYVNVHNSEYPTGAVQGSLSPGTR
jgi:hypothetical protein